MEECEAVCDRLTVMVSGVMKCIGTVQHLKKRYAQGFSLMVKIIDTSYARDNVDQLKSHIAAIFNPKYTTFKEAHGVIIIFDSRNIP